MSATQAPVCVIGAGPGGLTMAAALKQAGIPFAIVDAGRQPGGIWDIGRDDTPMYESAHFISSRRLSGFRGFPMPETYPDYPRHDRILEYVRSYAKHHDLESHITFGVRVESARRREEGGWVIRLDSGEARECRALCVATGNTWYPRMPQVPGQFDGEQYHSREYRSSKQFEGKRVLVVGAGNSGADIACDAARAASRRMSPPTRAPSCRAGSKNPCPGS